MSIYNYSVDQVAERNTPPILRQPKLLAWFRTLLRPFQYHVDRTRKYSEGDPSVDWDVGSFYDKYQTVRFTDNSVYESKINGNIGIDPIGHASSSDSWVKVQETYIGVDERMNYNCQIIVLAAAFNKHFRITSAPFAYIQNGSPTFNIFVPVAVWTALGNTNQNRDNAVLKFANKYKLGGTTAAVSTF